MSFDSNSLNKGKKLIGKIIRSENQILYWVQVYNELEQSNPPNPEDYAFGNFVKIESVTSNSVQHVGLINDTILIDRDTLRAGPRLSINQEQIQTFFPEFIDERIKIVRIIIIGYIDKNNIPNHTFPETTPNLDDNVYKMAKDEIINFHIINNDYKIAYLSQILQMPKPIFAKPLILSIIPKLMEFFPENKKPILKLIKNNIEFGLKLEEGF